MPIRARVVGQVPIDPDDHLTFKNETVRDGDFSGRRLVQLASVGSRFEHCRFERMRVQDASLGAGVALSEYVECSFDGSRMTLNSGGYARFVRCSFRDVDLRNWDGDHVELIDCVFTGRLRSVNFWGAPLADWARRNYESYARRHEKQGLGAPSEACRSLMLREYNEFHGNDFSGADLDCVEFRGGIDLSRQILPSGEDYLYLPDAQATIDRALAALAEKQADDLSEKIERFLRNVLGRDLEQGQYQLLIRERDFASRGQVDADVSAAFGLLRDTAAGS